MAVSALRRSVVRSSLAKSLCCVRAPAMAFSIRIVAAPAPVDAIDERLEGLPGGEAADVVLGEHGVGETERLLHDRGLEARRAVGEIGSPQQFGESRRALGVEILAVELPPADRVEVDRQVSRAALHRAGPRADTDAGAVLPDEAGWIGDTGRGAHGVEGHVVGVAEIADVVLGEVVRDGVDRPRSVGALLHELIADAFRDRVRDQGRSVAPSVVEFGQAACSTCLLPVCTVRPPVHAGGNGTSISAL